MSTHPRLSPLISLLSFLAIVGVSISSSSLAATTKQKQIYSSKAIINQLLNWHYSQKYFDDNLSSELFDNYLEKIDSRKQFLLQSDIKEFEQYRHLLDNHIKKGNLIVSEKIYKRFQLRYKELLLNTLNQWPQSIQSFDFNKDETLLVDRKQAQWPQSKSESQDLWRKSLKNMVLSLKLADKNQQDIEKILSKRLKFQLKNLEQSNDDDIFQIFMNSLTELYDPHTNYFSPQTSENFNINMSLRLQGIGAVLQIADGDVKVVRLVPAGPAEKQGELKPNDRIIAVGQGATGEMTDVVGWRLDDVVNLIRGKPKTTVRLEIVRGKASKEKHHLIQIVRDNVKLEEQSAHKAIIEIKDKLNKPQKVGIIKIPTFYIDFAAYHRGDPNYKSTTRDVQQLLRELEKENVAGVVIDLRGNGGGSLLEANALTGLFIKNGPVVQIRQSNNRVYPQGKRNSGNYYQGQLVVLIDRLSASASEIFAAAIQDYHRGLIIGDQSYGKGTVQTMKELPYGSLKITESKFYRISGESTQHRGVIPDIQLPSLYNKDLIGESSLEHALLWDKIPAIKHQNYFNFSSIINQLKINNQARVNADPDFIFLKQQQSIDLKDEKIISLNIKQRIKQKNDWEKKLLSFENQRRKKKGLAPIKTLEDLEGEETSNQNNFSKIDTKNDYFLTEAVNVLLDANQLISNSCQTTHNTWCNAPLVKNIIHRMN